MESSNRKILISLLCVLLAIPVGMVIASLIVLAFSISEASSYGIIVTYVVMFGFVIVISMILNNLSRPRVSRFNPLLILWGFVTIVLWNCSVSPLAEYLPDFGIDQLESIASTGWLSVLTAVVIAPFMEEWIFRGILTENLRRLMNPLWAIMIPAVIFGLSHVYPVQVLTAFGAGLVLGSFYLITRSIISTILMHIIYNGFIYSLYVFFPSENDDILVDLVPSEAGRAIIWVVAFILFLLSSSAIYRRLKNCDVADLQSPIQKSAESEK